MNQKKINYKNAGVDIEKADLFVDQIKKLTRQTLNKKVVSGVGGFASLYELNKNQLLAAGTDGVGTKLKLAFESGIHHTIGVDLVAMCVNDLLCVGARPLFFLDYFATGSLDRKQSVKVLEGIVKGCLQSQCALVGGETAEMPGLYQAGEYDLAGFAVGLVDKKKLLPKKNIQQGDVILGLPSSGFHSNGFSLLRKLIPTKNKRERSKWIQSLLTPTKIYVPALLPLMENGWVEGAAHITGSGFLNIPRISNKVDYEIFLPKLSHFFPLLSEVQMKSGLSLQEMLTTFNCGIGMVLIVKQKNLFKVKALLKKEKVITLGNVCKKNSQGDSKVLIHSPGESLITLT